MSCVLNISHKAFFPQKLLSFSSLRFPVFFPRGFRPLTLVRSLMANHQIVFLAAVSISHEFIFFHFPPLQGLKKKTTIYISGCEVFTFETVSRQLRMKGWICTCVYMQCVLLRVQKSRGIFGHRCKSHFWAISLWILCLSSIAFRLLFRSYQVCFHFVLCQFVPVCHSYFH